MTNKILKIIIFIFLSFFIMASAAFAANWVYATKIAAFEDEIPSNAYVDADSVVQEGSSLYFWEVITTYEADEHTEHSKSLSKIEVKLDASPRKDRKLFFCDYYPNGKPKGKPLTETRMWRNVWPESSMEAIINMALKYAKPGKDKGIAAPPQVARSDNQSDSPNQKGNAILDMIDAEARAKQVRYDSLKGTWIHNAGNSFVYNVSTSGNRIDIALTSVNWGQGWSTPLNQSSFSGTISDYDINGTYSIEDTSSGVGKRGNGTVQTGPFSGKISADGHEIVIEFEYTGLINGSWVRYPSTVRLKR